MVGVMGQVFCGSSLNFFSQIFTDEQKPFCSQGEPTNAGKRRQMSQSLSANFGYIVLCYRLTWCLCVPLWNLFFCVVLWEKKKNMWEREWPLPQPLPRREGAWSPRYPYNEGVRFVLSSYQQPYRGNLTYLVCHTIFLKNLLFLVYAITKEGKVGF